MINVRLYQEVVLPYFSIKHGQFAAIALTRSGASKMLRKVWKAFILRRERLVLRDNHKNLNDQKKFDAQVKAAQQSASQKIDNRVDKNMAGLDAKVKSIIKETVKSQSIKKEAISFDLSLLECDLTSSEFNSQSFSQPTSSTSATRQRQAETIDLRNPTYSKNTKKQDFRKESDRPYQSSIQSKGYLL